MCGSSRAGRGYLAIEFAADRLTTRFRAISDPRHHEATVSTLKAFVVEDGRPRAVTVQPPNTVGPCMTPVMHGPTAR